MAEKLSDKEIVSYKEVILSEIIQSEALVNLLVKKGILTQEELIEEVIRVKQKMVEDHERIKRMKQ